MRTCFLKSFLVLGLAGVFSAGGAFAATASKVYSPSSVEVKFQYTASFVTEDVETEAAYLADGHASHLFGYMHSPTVVASFRIPDGTGGMGSPKLPNAYTIVSDKTSGAERSIKYRARGVLLLNKKAAEKLLPAQSWLITMPIQVDAFYDENCTDEHYNSFGDFWYFYDPFRRGCSGLRKAPLAGEVEIKLAKLAQGSPQVLAGFSELRGDNGNGEYFEITTINGFSEDAKDSNDEGRVSFEEMNAWFKRQGFTEKVLAKYENRPVYQFEKLVVGQNGQTIKVRITRLLAETSISSRNVTFAKFFKRAVKESDVIIYAGHSGLGGNLDLGMLEEKVGPLEFLPNKQQVFFFDGCSSYAYYLSMFESQKPLGTVSVLTNGLSSYFHTEADVGQAFYKHLLNPDTNPTWGEVLGDMESVLLGDTYMLSVGGLR